MVRIITDGTSDMTAQQAAELNIDVIPMRVFFGQECFLDGVDITCTVAPAVIFYNVYECDEAWVAYDAGEAEEYSVLPADVDTSAAGANVLLAAGSTNTVTGSHVARIYKEGTTKKLHKYDGAFYSRMRQSTPSNPTLPKNTDGTKRPPVLCGPGAVAE